jgi:hypothetical protein
MTLLTRGPGEQCLPAWSKVSNVASLASESLVYSGESLNWELREMVEGYGSVARVIMADNDKRHQHEAES